MCLPRAYPAPSRAEPSVPPCRVPHRAERGGVWRGEWRGMRCGVQHGEWRTDRDEHTPSRCHRAIAACPCRRRRRPQNLCVDEQTISACARAGAGRRIRIGRLTFSARAVLEEQFETCSGSVEHCVAAAAPTVADAPLATAADAAAAAGRGEAPLARSGDGKRTNGANMLAAVAPLAVLPLAVSLRIAPSRPPPTVPAPAAP